MFATFGNSEAAMVLSRAHTGVVILALAVIPQPIHHQRVNGKRFALILTLKTGR